jgi:hypothetical protein
MPWFLAALIDLGVYVGTAILSALLNRQPKQASAPDEPQFPKADATAPIPVVFGTTRVGINVIHKAHVTRGENTARNGALSFGWSSTHVGYYYYLDFAAVLCHGPVGALHDIVVDETKFLSRTSSTKKFAGFDLSGLPGYSTFPTVFASYGGSFFSLPFYTSGTGAYTVTVTAGDLLGGKFERGGIGAGSADAASTGQLLFYPGNGWNEQNARLETLAGQDLPTYPDLCWVALGPDFYMGNAESLPALEFVLTRAPQAPFLGTGLLGNVTANSGADASVAGILWEILTNPVWGLGLPASDLDESSFNALDDACNGGLDDGTFFLGLSFVVTTQVSAKQLLSDVLRTCDGVLYTDPVTGLLNVRLLQSPSSSNYGYGISNECILDASVIRSVEWTESAPDAQANEVKVEFVDRARGYTSNTVTVRNVAAIQALGRVESRAVSFLGVQDADTATRLATRELRALSTVLGHATIEVDRTGFLLTPGQFFTLNWDVAGKATRIMRCIEQRDTPLGGCVIEAVEDVYSSPPSAFVPEATPEPTPADDTAYIIPYVEPEFEQIADYAIETLKVFDPQGHVTAVEFGETSANNWHVAYLLSPPTTPNPNPYINYVTRGLVDIPSRWRVSYTAQDGTTAYLIGDFPMITKAAIPETPTLRWTVSAGVVTVTATWNDTAVWGAVQPYLFMDHSQAGFPSFDASTSTPVGTTSGSSISFPYPAAGQVEYVSAWRAFNPLSGRQESSEYAYLTIVGDSATVASIGTTLGQIGIPTVFVNTTEASQWLALSTIPTAATEIGAEFRRRRYLVGAGSVRIHANVKAVTGTPTIGLYYDTTSAFGAPVSLQTLSVTGTGQVTSGWAALPSGAKADAYLTPYVADGANTAAVDLYALQIEFLPTTVAGVREHSTEHAPEYS